MHRSPVTRFGLSALLGSFSNFRICAETDSVPEARELFFRHDPAAIVLGLSLRYGDGIALIKDFKKATVHARTLVLSDRTDALSVQRAFRAGARGYMTTHDDISEIPRALRQILSGEFYASPSVSQLLLQILAERKLMKPDAALTQLSDRELQVFGMIGRGLGTSGIAKELHLSVKTIETHQMRMKQKLDLRNGAELNRRAETWVRNQLRKRERRT